MATRKVTTTTKEFTGKELVKTTVKEEVSHLPDTRVIYARTKEQFGHPYLIGTVGRATWDDNQKSWLYKVESTRDWYRVNAESLEFPTT